MKSLTQLLVKNNVDIVLFSEIENVDWYSKLMKQNFEYHDFIIPAGKYAFNSVDIQYFWIIVVFEVLIGIYLRK